VKVDTELTVKDYEAFFLIATRRAFAGEGIPKVQVRYWLRFTLGFTAWIALGFLFLFFFHSSSLVQTFLLLAAYVAFYIFWRRHSRRVMSPEQGGILLGSHTFSLTSEGFEDQGTFSYSLTKWPAIRAIEETPEHLFVFIDKTAAHIVPKRCFPHPEDYDVFLQELREHLPSSSGVTETATPSRTGVWRLMPLAALVLAVILFTTLLLSRTHSRQASRNHEDITKEVSDKDREEGEDLLYSQIALVEKQTSAILSERPGVIDSYFLGFGSDADQDVFMNEVLYARQLFDRLYDTRGRSIALINNPKTKKELPLASFTNLRITLQHLGRRLNSEEDILFLFLTSHGSRDHVLSVDYWPLPLKGISSTALAGMLEESGIKWRVIIISACYSGGFIDDLKNDHTLIITSSSATRPSFGCGEADELTYFGKAFFKDQLNQGIGLLQAFSGAVTLVQRREAARKLKASGPQLSSPPAISDKLKDLEVRLAVSKPH
jgi:hypothetical protein